MSVLEKPFKKMGARVSVVDNANLSSLTLNVRTDRKGEYFDVQVNPNLNLEVSVLDVKPKDRHLLLLTRRPGTRSGEIIKQKFLCGHDERHWFVAAVPETAAVSTVNEAKTALKPEAIHEREQQVQLPGKNKNRRKNAAFKRQGEWFFVPIDLQPNKLLILKNEPFSRGRGKSHYAEEAYRTGGTTVYVSGNTILDPTQFNAMSEKERKITALGYSSSKCDDVCSWKDFSL
jgi:hypothetical protein